MTFKNEAVINVLIAFFVLLSAMFDPRLSVTLAVIFLAALAVYHWVLPPKTR